MLLPDHNGHLVQIASPAIPADPGLNIVGSPGVVRWTGDAEAYVVDTLTDQLAAGQVTRIMAVVIDLPANIPVVPNQEDILTVNRLTALGDSSVSETFIVRQNMQGFLMLGKIRFMCRRS